ncbi:MAG TPA: hypothetical protein VKU36_04025 [Candidatus Babeliales bacterium]|nr:hypothetical protein [Candidatus Babeliales bacterium]
MKNTKKLLPVSIMLMITLVSGQIFGMRNVNENPKLTEDQRNLVWRIFDNTEASSIKVSEKLNKARANGNESDIQFLQAMLERHARIKKACRTILFGVPYDSYTDKQIDEIIYPS